jgi:MFS family permease
MIRFVLLKTVCPSACAMIRNVRLLYIHNFLTDFRFQEAFIIIWFRQITGSYTTAMAIFALTRVTSAVMDIPTGIFSDQLGRRYTIILASLCTVMMVVCYAIAHAPLLLCAGAFFSGLSESLFSGNNDALLFESLKAQNKEGRFHHYQGRTKSMFQLALSLSALASSLIVPHGLRLVFALGVIPQILALITALFFKEPRIHIKHDEKDFSHLTAACVQIWHNPRLLLLMMAQAISYGAGESNFFFKSAYVATLWPSWAVGLYRGMNHAYGFLGFWLSGFILDRVKGGRFLAFREIYWFVTQSIALVMANVVTPLIIMTGAFVYGPGEVARDQLMQKEFTDRQRATMASVGSFFASMFFAVMAILIGIVADRFGLAAGVFFGLCVNVTSLPIYVRLFRKYL